MAQEPYKERLEQCKGILATGDLDAVALNPGPDLSYLTGLAFHLMERPVVGIFLPDGPPHIIHPALESEKLQDSPYPVHTFPYSEDRSTWLNAFRQALKSADLLDARIGVIPRRLRVLEMRFLERAAPGSAFPDAQGTLSALRIRKDLGEIQALQEAVETAQNALEAIQDLIKPGISERDLSLSLVSQLLKGGSDPELPFFPIISFGPNSANPHASPTDRVLQSNEVVLIDWGARVDGYCSDITRVFSVGEVDQEMRQIADVVREANHKGRQLVQPGAVCSEIDQAVREVVQQAGYGEYFMHRTGHGLGREAHEEPYITAGDDTRLEAGMTFTIEPGIYLPGRGGVRIEDDVLVTDDGCHSFSNLSRDLIPLAA